MACISSSSRTKSFDVFISFRGEDTRNGFTDHLFAALHRKGVVAFRDDHTINKGQLLEPELFHAIQGSRVFIVVFSKDYASSTWCLKELTMILDLVQQTGRSVLPVFYDVTPSEVRKQTGLFAEAFVEHEQRFKDDLGMVQKWREALKLITNRCGWDVQNKPQHEEIEKIVEEVINILGHSQILSFGDELVDIHSRLKQLEDLLDLGANETVRVVGICGMGGIGKTTIATALYNKISSQYDACCFIDDVSKIYGDFGPIVVQKQLLCQALDQGNIEINNVSKGAMMVRTRLCNLKTLIVLDNVDHIEQLEKLALHPKYLGEGSRIIIISRDSHILRNYGVKEIYNVQLLDKNKALQLFCKKAFKSDDFVEEYKVLTYDVLSYANGLPLAIKVLGSYLFDRNIDEWRSALAMLRENPSTDIMDVLRISFDGLQEMEKEIFLDIACFYSDPWPASFNFWGWPEKRVKEYLAYRGFYPDIGMEVLIEKSLISLVKHEVFDSKVVKMHDLLKVLGKSIVKAKSPKEPRKWSRLRDYTDLHNVMTTNKESKNLEAIVIIREYSPEFQETIMPVDALAKLSNLQFVIFKNVKFSGTLNYLSNQLRYLEWDGYPFTCLPSNFHPQKLAGLILPNSNIKQLWEDEDTKCLLPNLRTLDLRHSKNLIEIPDLRGSPHLKILILEGCKNLVLDLNIVFGLNSLEELNLSGCSKLQHNHLLKKSKEIEYLEKVDKNTSVIQLITSSAYKVLKLPFHFLSSQKPEDSFGLVLPYLPCFQYLYDLDLSFCNILQIPDAIGNLHSLVSLDLGGNKFVTLPTTINQLSKLHYLNLQHCKQLIYVPELPTLKGKIEKKFGKLVSGLYIFDCPKLSENLMEHNYKMFFYWMMQRLEVYLKSPLFARSTGIVIPGSEIPRWFSKRSMGGSISIMDIATVMEDTKWIGVACCAVFVSHHHPANNYTKIFRDRENIGYGIRRGKGGGHFYTVPLLFNLDLVTVELDHLLMMFYKREVLMSMISERSNGMRDLGEMKFVCYVEHPEGLKLEVKASGYRWIYEEDLQHLKSNIIFTPNSSSRKRKRLLNSS